MVGFGITEHPYKRGPTSQLKKNRGTPTEFEGGDPREGYYDSQMVKNNLGYGRLPAAVLPPANYGTALAYDPNNAVRTYAPGTGFSAPLSAIDQATQINGRPVDEYGFYINSNPVAPPASNGGGFLGGILSGALDQASALKDNVVSGVQQVASAAPVLGGKVVDAVQENIMSDPGKMMGMLGPMLKAKMAGLFKGGGSLSSPNLSATYWDPGTGSFTGSQPAQTPKRPSAEIHARLMAQQSPRASREQRIADAFRTDGVVAHNYSSTDELLAANERSRQLRAKK